MYTQHLSSYVREENENKTEKTTEFVSTEQLPKEFIQKVPVAQIFEADLTTFETEAIGLFQLNSFLKLCIHEHYSAVFLVAF